MQACADMEDPGQVQRDRQHQQGQSRRDRRRLQLEAPARRLTGGRSLALVPSAVCGALLLVTADLVARRLFAPTELPVGVFTAILGAPYLLYLLARANRIGSGG